jgi:hypothetical protein
MATQITFERQPDGSVLRVEVPDDRAGKPSDYDRQLIAARAATAAPAETPADLEAIRVRMERQRAAMVAKTPPPVPASEYWHTSTERIGDKLVTKRSRRGGEVMATYETATAPMREPPVAQKADWEHGKRDMTYEEKLRAARR